MKFSTVFFCNAQSIGTELPELAEGTHSRRKTQYFLMNGDSRPVPVIQTSFMNGNYIVEMVIPLSIR